MTCWLNGWRRDVFSSVSISRVSCHRNASRQRAGKTWRGITLLLCLEPGQCNSRSPSILDKSISPVKNYSSKSCHHMKLMFSATPLEYSDLMTWLDKRAGMFSSRPAVIAALKTSFLLIRVWIYHSGHKRSLWRTFWEEVELAPPQPASSRPGGRRGLMGVAPRHRTFLPVREKGAWVLNKSLWQQSETEGEKLIFIQLMFF